MRTYSTPQSAYDGGITKLAIFECVGSVALYVGIGVYLGTFKYLALAVVFAPLMLFRTDVSARWGILLYERFTILLLAWFGDHHSLGDSVYAGGPKAVFYFKKVIYFLLGIIVFTVIPVVGVSVRIIATVYWAVRKPFYTLENTPKNWLRQAFCTDLASPPEILPLEATIESHDLNFNGILDFIHSEGPKLLILLVTSPIIVLGYIPAVIYRISFKATVLVYAPFIWVAHSTLRNPLPLKARLERITKGELEKVRRGLSWIIVTALAAKFALVFNLVDKNYLVSKFPSEKIVTNFVVLGDLPWWQLTLVTDAALTFVLLWFADAALARLDGQGAWGEDFVLKTTSTISFVRAALSILTISHFFNVAFMSTAPGWLTRLLTF